MLVEERTLHPGHASGTPAQGAAGEAPELSAVWAWAGVGMLGSLIAAFEGTHLLGTGAPKWFYVSALPEAHVPTKIVFWSGVALLCGAWLGLGRTLKRDGGPPLWALWVVGALWCLPFLLGPPLFSRDVYSYIAQGTIVHLGHNPYHEPPTVLARLGAQHVLNGVDSFWRHTTAPYGPLFLGVVSLIIGATNPNLVLGAVVVRLFNLLGLALLMAFAPRLARSLGTDPRRAMWLAALSPLVWLQLVSPAHNDLLMVGLMVAGVTLAARRRPLLGIAVCALAATVKVPAVAALAFIAVAWAWSLPAGAARVRALLEAALLSAAVAAAVTLITGLGPGWISGGLFSTPGRVRLAITPATALGYSIAHLVHHLGVHLNGKAFEATLSHIAFGITAAFGLWLLYRTRLHNMVRQMGILLAAVAVGGPAAWPWYFIWGLAVIAACPGPQRGRWIPLAVVVSAFIIIPNGQVALSLGTAPYVLAFYVLVAAAAAWLARRRRRQRLKAPGDVAAGALLAEP